jgi:hypothetical protein
MGILFQKEQLFFCLTGETDGYDICKIKGASEKNTVAMLDY